MTLESKRSLLKAAGWTTLAAAAALAGCGKKEEAPVAAAPAASAPASAAGAEAGAAAGAAGAGSSFLPQPARAAATADAAASWMRERFFKSVMAKALSGRVEKRVTKHYEPGKNGFPSDAGIFMRIHAGLREISASTTIGAR